MANQIEISSVLQDGSYYLVTKHYNNILRSQYALYTDNDYEEHEIQCLRILIKSLSREFVVDYTSVIAQELYLKLAKIVNEDDTINYSVDLTLQRNNQPIIVVNNIQDVQEDIDVIYITISDLQNQITNLSNTVTSKTFLSLVDTPNAYLTQANKLVVVNNLETALQFIVQPITKTQINSVSDVTVGAINAGDTIPINLTIEDLKNLIFNKTFFPDLNAPSFSLSNNAGLREIGESANFSATFNFNRGSIVLQGVTQNPRAGASNTYVINNITQSSNVLSLTAYIVLQGLNTITGLVNYLVGSQPLDSKENNFSTPLIAGTSPTQSTSFEGVYPLFATTSTITVSTKQTLVSMISGNNIQINLVAETGANKQFFEISNTWLTARPLTTIQYFNTVSNQFDITNKITDFTTSLTTKTIQGNIVNYTKYTYNGSDRSNILIRLIF